MSDFIDVIYGLGKDRKLKNFLIRGNNYQLLQNGFKNREDILGF